MPRKAAKHHPLLWFVVFLLFVAVLLVAFQKYFAGVALVVFATALGIQARR